MAWRDLPAGWRRPADKLQRQAVLRGHRHVAQHWTARKEEFEAEAEIVRKAVARADEINVEGGADSPGLT